MLDMVANCSLSQRLMASCIIIPAINLALSKITLSLSSIVRVVDIHASDDQEIMGRQQSEEIIYEMIKQETALLSVVVQAVAAKTNISGGPPL